MMNNITEFYINDRFFKVDNQWYVEYYYYSPEKTKITNEISDKKVEFMYNTHVKHKRRKSIIDEIID